MDEQKHSRLGIVSFITSIISGIMTFLGIVIAGVMQVSTPGGIDEEPACAITGAIIVGLLLIASLGVSLVALGLGIAGLMQKERKKIFAILGTVFSAVLISGIIFIIVLGLAKYAMLAADIAL